MKIGTSIGLKEAQIQFWNQFIHISSGRLRNMKVPSGVNEIGVTVT